MKKKLTLQEEEWQILESRVKREPILANAFRLMEDASLLHGLERYASTVALACYSLEEIGKYLLLTWSKNDSLFRYDKRHLHKMKQCAIAALFLCDGARKEYKAQGINFQKMNSVDEATKLAKAIVTGMQKEKGFATAAMNKVLETVKWSGIYYDEELVQKGISPQNIRADDAKSIMQSVSRAFMLLADEKNIGISKFMFSYFYKPGNK